MHACTFFSTAIPYHLNEKDIQIILLLLSGDTLNFLYVTFIQLYMYFYSFRMTAKKPTCGTEDQHPVLHDSKSSIIFDFLNCSMNRYFPAMNTKPYLKIIIIKV